MPAALMYWAFSPHRFTLYFMLFVLFVTGGDIMAKSESFVRLGVYLFVFQVKSINFVAVITA